MKTGFWQDDDVFELNSDTRLLYLCLLTNPQREILPAFRCSDRMLSAYTGYNKDLIDVCRKQLIASGRIIYAEADDKQYYIMTKQDFVQPHAGRWTEQAYRREFSKLPEKIQTIVAELHEKSSSSLHEDFMTYSNSISISKGNSSNEEKLKGVEPTFKELQAVFEQPKAKYATYSKAIRVVMSKGFSQEEIIAAAKTLAASPYHQGQNEQKTVYANIAFLFGNSDAENLRRVTKWFDLSHQNPKKKNYGF